MVSIALTPLCSRYSVSLTSRPIRVPTTTPPKNTRINSIMADRLEPTVSDSPCNTIVNRILNTTIAVASLKSDSPSTSTFSRSGAPSSLNSATTATGSVADISAPNSSATVSSMSSIAHRAKPTMLVEMSKAGTARVNTGARSFSSWRASRLNPDSNMSAGRNTKNTRSGERRNTCNGENSDQNWASSDRPIPITTSNTV